MSLSNIPTSKGATRGVAKGAAQRMAWNNIPPSLYMFIALPTLGCVGGAVYLLGYSMSGGKPAGGIKGIIYLACILVAFLVIWGLIALIKKRKKKKQAQAFEAGLKAEAAMSAGPVADPAEAARVDEIRQKFQKGIDIFGQYGKDVYDFPWYVMVGEPGAGKTEAIRNSSIHFPDGLQEKQQGVGGTYSMDWWFTDRAILLDTAGALLTEQASAARFEEFLKMLKTHRPACPINGMIIAISVQSLLLDDVEEADRKCVNLAQQLSMIQKTLGIRFGVYVMITKSDLITGFKEFCDTPVNTGYDRQMLGWSNPYDLDYAISPTEVCQELEQIVNELRYRRWNTLQDPIPKERDNRRIDEVDALYALPDAMSQVIERLSRYLDIVFSGGEWSEMPPFFRGVYFTSSKREGSALDKQLAQALGRSPDQLPEGGIWEREKSVYLRDLFMEKVFHETGLVTRLRDLGALMRKRLLFYYTLTAISLLTLLGLGYLFYGKITKQLASERRAMVQANELFTNGQFAPIVIERSEGAWSYNTREQQRLDGSKQELKGLSGFGFFAPLEFLYDRSLSNERQGSREVLAAGSVVKPLLDATRKKMLANGGDDEMDALLALLRVEAAVSGDRDAIKDVIEDFVRPLLRYVAPKSMNDAVENDLESIGLLMENFEWDRQEWMRKGTPVKGAYAFDKGLDRFVGTHEKSKDRQGQVSEAVEEFRSLEEDLFLQDRIDLQDAQAKLAELGRANDRLKAALNMGAGDSERYGMVWMQMKELCQGNREEEKFGFKEVATRLDGATPPPEILEVSKIGGVGSEEKLEPAEEAADPTKPVDPNFEYYIKRPPETRGRPLFEHRYEKYLDMMKPDLGDTRNLIGKMSVKLNSLKAKKAPSFDAGKGEAYINLCQLFSEHGVALGRNALADLWRRRVADQSVQSCAYPLVKSPKLLSTAEFQDLAEQWMHIKRDLEVLNELQDLPSEIRRATDAARNVCDVVTLLWDDANKQIANVEVSFSGRPPSKAEITSTSAQGSGGGGAFSLFHGSSVRPRSGFLHALSRGSNGETWAEDSRG